MIDKQTIAEKNLLRIHHRRMLADQFTPVGLYLKLREHFPQSVLLESNDFRSAENCHSLIGVDPIADFKVKDASLYMRFPNGASQQVHLNKPQNVPAYFQDFLKSFDWEAQAGLPMEPGFFGHTAFDGIQYFEHISFDADKRKMNQAAIFYRLYRFVILIDHFKDEMHLLEYCPSGEESQMKRLVRLLEITHPGELESFAMQGEVGSNLQDEEFRELVRKGKEHCQLGDVFQIVFARQFFQAYKGDEFQVYRVLRSINPSPYLFYFDYGEYKIFGSSPEAQL